MNDLEELRRTGPPWGAGLIEGLRLTRPRNCVLTGISVWVGAVTSGAPSASFEVALAAIGAAAIAASGNGMNDVIDLEVDRTNRPDRPLPSGRLSAGAALAISAMLGVTGLTLAFLAGILPGMIAFAVVISLALYNWFLKRTGLAGNVLVSLIAAATFPYGAAAATAIGPIGYPGVFGIAVANDKVYAFTDQGEIIEIDPATGQGSLVATYPDKSFWGAGVTPRAVID